MNRERVQLKKKITEIQIYLTKNLGNSNFNPPVAQARKIGVIIFFFISFTLHIQFFQEVLFAIS